MALVPKTFDTKKLDHKFSMKPQCNMCGEDYDCDSRIPKVMECGHSMCVLCIKKIIDSIQVTHVGDGESQTNFSCTICRSSMVIPDRGATAFPTNHELIETLKPSDIRFVTCTQCSIKTTELSFHICRECTIEKHSYDIKEFSRTNSDVGLDMYAICSTCAFHYHNNEKHTVVDFYPLRAHWYYQKYVLSVKATSSALQKHFGDVRTTLATTPILVENTENEIEKMVDFLRRCKSSQQQAMVLERYTGEMVIKLLVNVEKAIGDLNEHVTTKASYLKEENEKLEGQYCFKDVKDIHELLSKCVDPEPVPEQVFQEVKVEKEEVVDNHEEDEETIENPTAVVEKFDWNGFFVQILEHVTVGANWMVQNTASGIKKIVITAHDANNDNSAQTLPVKIGLVSVVFLVVVFIFYYVSIFFA